MVDYIIHFAYIIVAWVLSLLPAYDGLPSGITSGASTIAGYMKGLDCIVPVATYQAQFAIIAGIALALLGFRFFAWLFKWRVSQHGKE